MTSPFNISAPSVYEMGYTPIPLMPGQKRPGQWKGHVDGWIAMSGWSQYADGLDEWRLEMWQGWPDGNIGVCHTDEFGAMDFDEDTFGCHQAVKDILAKLDGEIVRRKGSKGYIQYFRLDGTLKSRVYQINKSNALEFLAKGRQSVLPPSIHPDTQKAYEWITPDTLDDTEIGELPLITREVMDEIEEVLKEYGWDAEAERDVQNRTQDPSGISHSSIYDECNRLAMRDLSAWVDDLRLYNCIYRSNGAYSAVATWRPSNGGRPDSERKRNLSIAPEGIKDFGDNRTYTPLDVVMEALGGVDLGKAFDWLWKRVGFALPEWSPKVKQLEELPEETAEVVKKEIIVEQIEQKKALDITDEDPFKPMRCKGVIEDVANFCLMNSPYPSEQYAMIAGLGIASTLYGRKYQTPTGSGLNLYLVGIGKSGYGKDAPLQAIKRIFSRFENDIRYYMGPDDMSSDSAIHKQLSEYPTKLFTLDEAGLFMQGIQGPKASSHEKRIKKAMLTLYSSSSSSWSGRANASDESTVGSIINHPNFVFIGMSTHETLFDGLSKTNMVDGLMARMLYFNLDQRPAYHKQDPSKQTPKPGLLQRIERIHEGHRYETSGNFDLSKYHIAEAIPDKHTVPWASKEAEDSWVAIVQWVNEMVDTGKFDDGISNRYAENTIRLATLRALSRDDGDAEVTVNDIQWAEQVVKRSISTAMQSIEEYMSEGDNERRYKSVLKVFENEKKTGKDYVTLSRLIDRMKNLDRKQLTDTLERLVLSGKIEAIDEGEDIPVRKWKLR